MRSEPNRILLVLTASGLFVLCGCKPTAGPVASSNASSSEASVSSAVSLSLSSISESSSATEGKSVIYADTKWGVSFQVPVFNSVDPPFTDTGHKHVYRLVEFGPLEKKQFGMRRYTMTDYGAPHSLVDLEETVKNNTTFHFLKDDLKGNPATQITMNGQTYLRWVLHQGCAQTTVTILGKTNAFSFSMCSKGGLASEVLELQKIASTVNFLK